MISSAKSFSTFCTLLVLCLAAICVEFSRGQDVPRPIPDYCDVIPSSGPCRASLRRYRYNGSTGRCEVFIWGGCHGINFSRNIFTSVEECEQTCRRSPLEQRAFNSTAVTCTFQANPTRECALGSFLDFSTFADLIPCIGRSTDRQTRDECVSRGCCWHSYSSSYNICYQKRSALVESTCSIKYASNDVFWGKVNFQADQDYPAGWIGKIQFNVNVTGGFCILRDRSMPTVVGISDQTFRNRQIFLLPSTRHIYAGENVTILFSGNYDPALFSTKKCDDINLPTEDDAH